MTARSDAAPAAPSVSAPREPLVGVLRLFLWVEAALGLAVAVLLSAIASSPLFAGMEGEVSLRFAASAAFIFAIAAAIAARGARRRRGWSWTVSAVLQLALAIGTGFAVIRGEWQPYYLIGFGLAAVVMGLLSTNGVRRALGQA
jgi:biotin transporter BioY